MATADEPWIARLEVPNYRLGEAARYARIAPGRARSWEAARNSGSVLQRRAPGGSLSYLQLIELAVVKAFVDAGIKLRAVREAREYYAKQFGTKHPFAVHRFKTDGKDLIADLSEIIGPDGADNLVNANRGGQIEWGAIIGDRLREFEYEGDLAVRWRVAGEGSPILIDPRIAFGAPTVGGKPTWLIKDRWNAGEAIDYIARDLGLRAPDVRAALSFEGVDISAPQPQPWLN